MLPNWERAELKSRAKNVLRSTYLTSLLVCFVLFLVIGGASNSSANGSVKKNINTQQEIQHNLQSPGGYPQSTYEPSGSTGVSNMFVGGVLAIVGTVLIVVILIGIFIRIFIGYTMEVGGRRFFVDTAMGEEDKPATLVRFFKEGKYKNIIPTLFKRDLFTFLWSLLFIVPGIIKSYEYKMIPYILADNPDISSERAFELSKRMTDGQKGKMFVLDLSFILWSMLSSLIPYLGAVLLMPYLWATDAQLYITTRDFYIDNGVIDAGELDLVPATVNNYSDYNQGQY